MRRRDFFAPGGGLASAHPGYEHRPGQGDMARAVARVLDEGGTLMVEAGTGTGKTFAYLIPVLESGRRVVVSTGTRNLQDQLFRRDLPFLAERAGFQVSACLMKGRENYLCRFRFAEFQREPLVEVRDERRFLAPLAAWSATTPSGDRAEVADLPDDLRLWRDINARADTCTGSRCPEYELCWLTKVKRQAQQAQIVVVNHHLFFADLAVRSAYGAVLPDYDTVIFDEAHQLEEIATLYFGTSVSSSQIEDLARDVERAAGAKGGGGAAALRAAAREFFAPVRIALGPAAGRQKFEPAVRGGLDLDREFEDLSRALQEIAKPQGRPGDNDAVETRARDLRDQLGTIVRRDASGFVYGMETRGRGNVVLSAAPVEVGDLLRTTLFDRLRACVLTSATLSVGGTFDFFRARLGLAEVESMIVESPFDHARQAILYLPRGMPEPREQGFFSRAMEEIEALLEVTRGRAFLLFTSHAALARARDRLAEGGRWPLLVQGEGSRAALVERFRETPRAVLLGTSSFWHGVDVPGEALSLVVIDKLPFDVPSDPLVAARIERIRENEGNPFVEYQTPLAVLDLKQGLGRLLRTRGDRGILAVLDPRLTTKAYGKTFLKSLPPYPVVRDRTEARIFFEGATQEETS
ncbi:MAG TPA: ATP-dependent DNA helicase [Candidatus Polarisedimenticolaceae bacterium]|nr:ATP-dependent DNA helicase [Candidatus Polarisedimenticolaceae bacterium]